MGAACIQEYKQKMLWFTGAYSSEPGAGILLLFFEGAKLPCSGHRCRSLAANAYPLRRKRESSQITRAITSTIAMMAVQKPALKIPPTTSQELSVTISTNAILNRERLCFIHLIFLIDANALP
jgi:hypothetical protein